MALEPRRKSTLRGRHPAEPEPVETSQDTEASRASAGTGGRADTRTQDRGDTQTGVPGDASPIAREDAGTQVRADAATSEPAETEPATHGDGEDQAEQRAQQKAARDAAYGWAAATRKQAKRGHTWAAVLDRARRAGVPPALLREQIEEAAYQAGTPLSAIPDEAWRAAGLHQDG